MHKALASRGRHRRLPEIGQCIGMPVPGRNKDSFMQSGILLLRLTCGLLFFIGLAAGAGAADATFVGKLALIADPEVAKELGLSDETKKKLMELIDKREQEAVALVAK